MNEAATLSRTLPVDLPLNNAFISYCAGISSTEEWEISGVDGHKDKTKSINFDCVDVFLRGLKSGENPPRKHVVDFALNLFSDYWAGEDIIKKYFNDKLFYFIIGPARSGGTYLLTQMYDAIGINYSNISRSVIRDSIPGSKHLVRGQIQAKEEINAIFELCQFLAWAKEEIKHSVIIQKNTCYAHWIPTLDKIFGTQAHYLVTARAPIACVASYIQLGLGFRDWDSLMSQWKENSLAKFQELDLPKESMRLKDVYSSSMLAKENPTVTDFLLVNWQLHYQDIVSFRPRGEVTVVEYGNPMLDFFSFRHPAYLKKNPNGLNWTPDTRDYISFIENFDVNYDLIHHVARTVHQSWATNNVKFPNFSNPHLMINSTK